jgi:hypothetical protein
MGVVDGLDEQTVGALELLDDGLGEVGEANGGVLVVEVLGELGNALGIRLGLELEALGAQEGLELLVVGDDTIVDDGELPGGVGPARGEAVLAIASHFRYESRVMRGCRLLFGKEGKGDVPVGVAVQARRRTVGGPAGVGDTGVGVEDLGEVGLGLLDELLELGDLANLLEGEDLVLLVAVDSQAGGIVATVLETGQTWTGGARISVSKQWAFLGVRVSVEGR